MTEWLHHDGSTTPPPDEPIQISAGMAPDAAARLNDLTNVPPDELIWSPRWGGAIGLDHTPGCFVCGPTTTDIYNSNISCFVANKEVGERITALFPHGARLDYRHWEPQWIQVKVGACPKHIPLLHALVAMTRAKVTPEAIKAVREAGGAT